MASTDAKAIPVKGAAYRVTFPILDADGDLVTAAATLDSEVSKDGGTFADCTNEATEIATSSGMYFLDLTATEMDADTVAIIVKTGTAGAKTTPIVLYTAARSVNDLAYPTVTGRSIDVSTGGEVGLDWANVGSPTTTVGLSGTTIKTATDVETDTADIQARLPAALTVGGNMKSDALAISGDTVAADNAESFFDGTGYAGTNNVIPTVTTLTGHTAQTGDAYAIVNSGTHGNAALKTLVDTVDTVVDGVKAKTDSLTFTVAGQVDANTKSVNSVTVTGAGTAGDPWGP